MGSGKRGSGRLEKLPQREQLQMPGQSGRGNLRRGVPSPRQRGQKLCDQEVEDRREEKELLVQRQQRDRDTLQNQPQKHCQTKG